MSTTFSATDLSRLKRRSYFAGVGLFLFDTSFYALSIAGTIAAPHLRQRILCAVIAGFWATALLILAHDACHHSLTPNRRLNRVLGTLAFLPALHTYSLWQYSHNHLHHLFTNLRGRDYVWEPLNVREYQSLSWLSRCRYRFFRTFIGHHFYYAAEIWWKRRFIPRHDQHPKIGSRDWRDFGFVVLWMIGLSVLAVESRAVISGVASMDLQAWFGPILVTLVLPFVTSAMLSSASEFLQHTHPAVHWYAEPGDWMDRQSRTAVHCQFPGVADYLMHWIMDHTAHHMQPAIPSYQLMEAQQVVEGQLPENVVKYRWSLRAVIDILRVCKLYDEQLGCWTDYEGRPTTKSRFAGQRCEEFRTEAA